MTYLWKALAQTNIRQFMRSKSISDCCNVENNLDKRFRSEFCSTSKDKWNSRRCSCW